MVPSAGPAPNASTMCVATVVLTSLLVAGAMLLSLARKLRISNSFIEPGYEDTWYYLWRERRLPVNVDPFDSRLDDEMERARLRRVFDQKLDTVVGYVLPLQPSSQDGSVTPLDGPIWTTGPWFFRDERMYLIPGDSAMGYRLPLDSLPWVSQADYPYVIEPDPTAPRDALPEPAAMLARYTAQGATVTGLAATDRATVPYRTGAAAPAEAPRRLQPQQIVCLDAAFNGDDALKTSIVLEARSHGVAFRTV